MSYGEALLVGHIIGAASWLGANVVQVVVQPVVRREGNEGLASWYRLTAALSTRLYIPAAILVLATGVLMVLDNEAYGFGDVFVTIGFSMIVIGALFGSFVFGPDGERAAEAASTGDDAALGRLSGKLAAFGTVDTLLLLFTIVAMVLRLD